MIRKKIIMVNQTDVKGKFVFEQGFYDRNVELIEDYFENAELANEYGMLRCW